mgnify:CR=1 FL=1
MSVLKPLKVVITNYDGEEDIEAINNPEDITAGTRKLKFSKEIFIEQSDFMEVPVKGYHRLFLGGEVRLRYAYIIKCDEVVKDENDNIIELRCTYEQDTKSGSGTSTKKVKGVIHWISANNCVDAEVRLYDRLFTVENPNAEENWLDFINPNSLEIIENAKIEAGLLSAKFPTNFQFERMGYFCIDSKYSSAKKIVFNRTVSLKDSWTKK